MEPQRRLHLVLVRAIEQGQARMGVPVKRTLKMSRWAYVCVILWGLWLIGLGLLSRDRTAQAAVLAVGAGALFGARDERWVRPLVHVPLPGSLTVTHASALGASAVGGFPQTLAPSVQSEYSDLHGFSILLYLVLATGIVLGLVGLLWQQLRPGSSPGNGR